MTVESCFICRKHEGQEPAPPGSYIYEDGYWLVCHAPTKLGPLGTLFIESRRHFLDYAEMNTEEAETLGPLLQKVYGALKLHTHAERIYQLSTMEGQPHLHIWLVPRRKEHPERGLKFLGRDDSCLEEDAILLASRLHISMHK